MLAATPFEYFNYFSVYFLNNSSPSLLKLVSPLKERFKSLLLPILNVWQELLLFPHDIPNIVNKYGTSPMHQPSSLCFSQFYTQLLRIELSYLLHKRDLLSTQSPFYELQIMIEP